MKPDFAAAEGDPDLAAREELDGAAVAACAPRLGLRTAANAFTPPLPTLWPRSRSDLSRSPSGAEIRVFDLRPELLRLADERG